MAAREKIERKSRSGECSALNSVKVAVQFRWKLCVTQSSVAEEQIDWMINIYI